MTPLEQRVFAIESDITILRNKVDFEIPRKIPSTVEIGRELENLKYDLNRKPWQDEERKLREYVRQVEAALVVTHGSLEIVKRELFITWVIGAAFMIAAVIVWLK